MIVVVRVGRVGGKSPAPGQHQAGRLSVLYTMDCTVQETSNYCHSQGRMGGRETPVLTGAWTKSRQKS
jgi:hypothetical protein